MKKHLKKLFILIPLIFVAGATFAAYSFTGPTAPPSANNTDGPLIDTSLNQVKNGGLSVNAFAAAKNSFFNQDVIFTGTVFGGTPAAAGPVAFGNTTNKVSVAITGSQSITGTYQSDTLKTGGGEKPLCADENGTFYICGTTKTAPVNNAPMVSIRYVPQADGSYAVGAQVSQPLSTAVEVYLNESGPISTTSPVVSFLNSIKNAFTADARLAGVCYPPSGTQSFGSVGINALNLSSWNTIPLPQGCTTSDLIITISTVSPGSVDGQTLQYSSAPIAPAGQ
jgi:hypothetical protein